MIHFLQPGEDEGQIRDLAFYREYVQPLDTKTPRFSFMLGYFTHLVADNLWMHFIGEDTQAAFDSEFVQDRAATWERVKDDWYGLDRKYQRDHLGNVFERYVVAAPNLPSTFAFLPTDALAYRLDDLREFYSAPSEFVLDRNYPYLAEATMDRVVGDCADAIGTLLARLLTGDVAADAAVSLRVLTLPSPYVPP